MGHGTLLRVRFGQGSGTVGYCRLRTRRPDGQVAGPERFPHWADGSDHPGHIGRTWDHRENQPGGTNRFNELVLDPTAYDLVIDAAAGGDFIFSPWQLVYDQNRNNGTTANFFLDDQLQALLKTASSLDGFTPENLDAFQQYQKEQMYAYGMLSFKNLRRGCRWHHRGRQRYQRPDHPGRLRVLARLFVPLKSAIKL